MDLPSSLLAACLLRQHHLQRTSCRGINTGQCVAKQDRSRREIAEADKRKNSGNAVKNGWILMINTTPRRENENWARHTQLHEHQHYMHFNLIERHSAHLIDNRSRTTSMDMEWEGACHPPHTFSNGSSYS